jgi:hypothetical protein
MRNEILLSCEIFSSSQTLDEVFARNFFENKTVSQLRASFEGDPQGFFRLLCDLPNEALDVVLKQEWLIPALLQNPLEFVDEVALLIGTKGPDLQKNRPQEVLLVRLRSLAAAIRLKTEAEASEDFFDADIKSKSLRRLDRALVRLEKWSGV